MPPPATNKAYLLYETNKADRIPCMFNPGSFSVTRSNTWEGDSAPGKEPPQLRFKGAESGSFSLELFFDTTDTGQPVTNHTRKLENLMNVDLKIPGTDEASNNQRPPWVQFGWGRWKSFKAVITSLTVNLTYFSSDGVPLRATASLSLKQYLPEGQHPPQNPTSGTPTPHRVHRVQPGETLDRIAAQHYGSSNHWRLIAAANDVEDPMEVRPGALLAIPKLGE